MLSLHELDSRLCARHRQDNLSMPIWLAALANGGDDGSDVIRFTDVPDAGVSSHGCVVLAKTSMLVYAPSSMASGKMRLIALRGLRRR